MSIKCMIVDDEPLALDILENYIKRIPNLQLVRRCTNAVEAFEYLQNNSIELIFLDIHMPELTGIDFMKSLSGDHAVIFTTAYPNYAMEGFNLDVIDYLLKPVPFDRFLKAVDKAGKVLKNKAAEQGNSPEENKDFIFVKTEYKITKVNYKDILYVEGMKDYVKIFTEEGMIVTHQTMKNMEGHMPSNKFIRTHRSYIVAFDKIKSVIGNSIQINDQMIPIGQSYRSAFFTMVEKYNLSR